MRSVFAEELEKLAADVVRSRAALAPRLEPGDILVTSNAPTHHGGTKMGRFKDRVLKLGIRTVYGDAGHTALYAGDGRAVEMSNKLVSRRLEDALKGKDVHVYRPQAPAEVRSAVAAALESKARAEGEDIRYVGPGTLARALVEEAAGKKVYGDAVAPVGEKQRYTCTNIIAAAYKDRGVDFAPNKTTALVSPADFVRSDKTRRVASFINPGRHDKERRRGLAEYEKAASEAVTTRADLAAKLQPGDIIISSPNKAERDATKVERAGGAVFTTISQTAYGDNAHASIYTGDNTAVEMFSRLAKVPLATVVKNRDAKVYRPSAPKRARALAAARAEAFAETVGARAEYAKPLWLLKLLAADTKTLRPLVLKSHDAEMKQDRPICSNTVSMAYKGIVDFHDEKPHGYITPTDLATSKHVKEIATYYNPKRWDAKKRRWGKS